MLMERNEGLLERSLVSGITGTEILFAQVVTQFVVMTGQTLMVLIVAFACFQLTCDGEILWVTVLTILTGLCGMCFGKDYVKKICSILIPFHFSFLSQFSIFIVHYFIFNFFLRRFRYCLCLRH